MRPRSRLCRIPLTSAVCVCMLLLGACGDDDGAYDGDGSWGGSSDSGYSEPEPSSSGGSNDSHPGWPDPGQLTAGDWDDNLNYDWFLTFVAKMQVADPSLPVIQLDDRVVLSVLNDLGEPVSGAHVVVSQGDQILLQAPSGTDGRLLFFPARDRQDSGVSDLGQGFTVAVTAPGGQSAVGTVHAALAGDATALSIELSGVQRSLPDALDLAFVIDTTGSMTDELSYLQAEVQSIVDLVLAQAGNLSLRFALILYRDHGDAYVTRTFDFTGSAVALGSHLSQQGTDGGGDYPEAVEEALTDLNQLSWRDGNVARVAFWIADAPSHTQDMPTVLQEIHAARRAGIRMYPVASSGVAGEAELLMRVAAQSTLARYLFLTDDSGIGNDHAEPHIPCYRVQFLNQLMIRMIRSVLRGEHVSPDAPDVLRTVGDPTEGVCHIDGHPDAYLN